MKKLFLLILAGGIMMTACKKEESQTYPQNLFSNLKNLKLNASNLMIDSALCDKFFHLESKYTIYVIKDGESKFPLVHDYIEYQGGSSFDCINNYNECNIDHKRAILWVKKGADKGKNTQ